MNLNGLCVLNTRPIGQNQSLSQAIREAGGVSIEVPALSIESTTNEWLKKLPNLDDIDQAIFISTNAVNYFFEGLDQQQTPWPKHIKTIAVGKASASALEKWGIPITHSPETADSEHLLGLAPLQQVKRQTIVLVKGEEGRSVIKNTLLARGAHVISLDVYRRTMPTTTPLNIDSLWHDDAVDIILFTSEHSIHNIIALFGERARAWISQVPCVVISERLAKAAALVGMQRIIVSRYDMILTTLEEYNQGRRHDDQKRH